jgi:hypothetical protein
MQVLLIAGGLEPGRDGVGDYCRILGRELAGAGHGVRILAIHDREIGEARSEREGRAGAEWVTYRLPASLPWEERGKLTRSWLADFSPDWCSLQFVPFAFDDRGLCAGLGGWLVAWVRSPRWHVMVHETWVGFTRIATWKHRFWGGAQRLIFRRVMRALRPAVVHTSIPLYAIMLRRAGVAARILPIPSNIPRDGSALSRLSDEFGRLGLAPAQRCHWSVLGTFGTIHPGHDYRGYFQELVRGASANHRRLAVLTMGRTGTEGGALFAGLEVGTGGIGVVHHFGERSPADVSAYLQLLDRGVATIPEVFLGKSGSYAAMRLHGLEVMVPRRIELPDYASDLQSYPDPMRRASHESFGPEHTGARFLQDLGASACAPQT